nr:histidine kinase [uncultured Flavobacterium sp.]
MNKLIKSRFLRILLHALVWLSLFCLPYLLASSQNLNVLIVAERVLIPLVLSALLFYINYLWLTDRLLFRKKRLAYFCTNILLIALFVSFRIWAREFFFVPDANGPKEKPPVIFFIYFDSISFLIPWAIAVAASVFERWIKTEAERKESENARLQSELEHLKYQLQPHFFFNSLNNIYALVDISPEKAKMTILALSTLMRYLLYESNTGKVSLDKETEFLLRYIELMQLRTSANTTIETDFEEIPADAQIAPLLLIPLIENAFKHGISATKQNRIHISMRFEQGWLHFETRNGNYPRTETDRSGSGIGLKNIQKRLELIYPEGYTFTKGVEGSEFIARLILKLG